MNSPKIPGIVIEDLVTSTTLSTHQYCHILRAWKGKLQSANVSTTTISMRMTPRRALRMLYEDCGMGTILCWINMLELSIPPPTATADALVLCCKSLMLLAAIPTAVMGGGERLPFLSSASTASASSFSVVGLHLRPFTLLRSLSPLVLLLVDVGGAVTFCIGMQ